MVTRLTSLRQLISTLTSPAPDCAFDLDGRQFFLRLLHVVLHLLGLLHQPGELVLHHPASPSSGLIESGMIVAPNPSISSRTKGSLLIASVASDWRCSRAWLALAAAVPSPVAPSVTESRTGRAEPFRQDVGHARDDGRLHQLLDRHPQLEQIAFHFEQFALLQELPGGTAGGQPGRQPGPVAIELASPRLQQKRPAGGRRRSALRRRSLADRVEAAAIPPTGSRGLSDAPGVPCFGTARLSGTRVWLSGTRASVRRRSGMEGGGAFRGGSSACRRRRGLRVAGRCLERQHPAPAPSRNRCAGPVPAAGRVPHGSPPGTRPGRPPDGARQRGWPPNRNRRRPQDCPQPAPDRAARARPAAAPAPAPSGSA